MIDQATIDRILDAARIEEVVGEFVTLRKRGVNYIGLCPFHDERTPSFSVSPTKGLCKCFSCGKGGNVIHFIMEHEQLRFNDALKWLAKKYHIEIAEEVLTPAEQQIRNDRESMFILNEFARDYFTRILHEHIDGKSLGMGYFRERGFREDVVRKFQLGFSLDKKDAFSIEAQKKGYQKEFLLKTGLSLAYENGELHDRYRTRVMFPVHTLSGKVVAFGGRILKKDEKTAKYVNSPESDIYHKSNELYGIFFAKQSIAKNDKCYLVEGYTDVISMHQAGIENVVASSGTALTHGQIRMIHRFTQNVTVLYDGDAAGIKASLKGINLLLEEGLNVKVLLLPDGEDPDSFSRKNSATAFAAYIKENETDFIRFKTNILLKEAGNDPVRYAHLIQDLVESLSLIADNITRSVYIKECSRQVNFDEQLLQEEVGKKRRIHTIPTPGHHHTTSGISHTESQAKQASATGSMPIKTETATAKHTPKNIDQFERNIIKQIIRLGECTIGVEELENGTTHPISVIEYILKDLLEDQITMENPIYQQILKEAGEHKGDAGFKSERYFLNHRDPDISLLAANLICEPYELSKIHSRFQTVEKDQDKLDELIPHILVDLKNAIIQNHSQQLEEELKKAQHENDAAAIERILTDLKEIHEIKKHLSKNLGERIVVR